MKRPCVYILASKRDGTLYVGVTSNPWQRMQQHRQGLIEGFTKRYNLHQLVYYAFFDTMDEGIHREHCIKEWKRAWKVRLIAGMNPEWDDLYNEDTGEIFAGPHDVLRERDEGRGESASG